MRATAKTIVASSATSYDGLDEERLPNSTPRSASGDAFTAVRTRRIRCHRASLRREVAGLDPCCGWPITSLATGMHQTLDVDSSWSCFWRSPSLRHLCRGVYSVLAYLVSQRTKEIGVRLAIGASPSGVVWLFVREGMILTAVGLTAGLVGALAAGRWIQTFLFGVMPADPTTFAGVGFALTVAAVLPTYLSARRAARVDPTAALRAD
jgi:hypothetical protein